MFLNIHLRHLGLLFLLLVILGGCGSETASTPEGEVSAISRGDEPTSIPAPESKALLEWLAEEAIEATAKGASINSVSLEIRNLTAVEIAVEVPAGTHFNSGSRSVQNMVNRRSEVIMLAGGQSAQVTIDAACANMERSVPDESESFTIQAAAENPELELLLVLLDEERYPYEVEQAAIWIVTDDADYDDLGTLVGGFGFSSRLIHESEAAQAMQLVANAGINLQGKRIWQDRYRIAEQLEGPGLLDEPLPESLGAIAFQSDRDGNDDIFLLDLDSGEAVNLTQHSAADTMPAWSPDGEMLSFTSDRSGIGQIYIINVDGSGVVGLTQSFREHFSSDWSPDGSQIVFDADADQDPETFGSVLFTIDVATRGETQLTSAETVDFWPAWSPDGVSIAFTSNRDNYSQIYIMDADGSEQTRLTGETFDSSNNWYPVWSPDGKRIAFSSRLEEQADLYVMDRDGSNVVRLTYNEADDYAPAWSPDGEYIAFVSLRGGNEEIYLVRSGGGGIWRLTDNPARDDAPTWQPLAGE